HEEAAEVHLPELEEVAEDEELAALGAHVVDERSKLGRLVARFEIVTDAAVAEVQIADDEDVTACRIHGLATAMCKRYALPKRRTRFGHSRTAPACRSTLTWGPRRRRERGGRTDDLPEVWGRSQSESARVVRPLVCGPCVSLRHAFSRDEGLHFGDR